ncbi:MAG: hypothetical protein PHP46_05800, partial [Candidatus Omnitrophica bacterium]|nr:hypothetical protein [Candidatus Omnitrophota bacterium]
MDWQSARNKKWIRVIASFVIICFLHQDIIWATDGIPVWSKGPNGSFSVKPANTANGDVNIPRNIAETKEVYTTKVGDKTIINIQDAHASLGAQYSIASILDSLVTNYDLKLVAVEGSSGYIDTSLLRTFPVESIRKKTAEYLMKQGKMSAGEFFSITSEKPIALYGIENKGQYLENLDQFRKIYDISGAISKDIKNLTSTIDNLKERVYSQELKELDSNSVLHQDGKITFSSRWNYITNLASKLHIDYKKYENLTKLVESLKLEKGINFEKANKERDILIDVLSKKLPKHELEQLVLKSLSFKMNKISQGEYYLYLQELGSRFGIDPKPYENLIRYTDYITLYESIDLIAIFEEVKQYEGEVKERLFTNQYQRKIHDYSRFIASIKDLFEIKLTNQDVAFLIENLNNFNKEDFALFIKDASIKYNVLIDTNYDLDKIFDNIPLAVDFYKTADDRNSYMLANTIKRMDEEGQSVAALITGGYHSKGLSELLKQKQTSYLVILPKFDASKGERPYVAILTNKKEPYEGLLQSGQYYLAATSYFPTTESFKNHANIMAYLQEVIFVAVATAKLEGRDAESVKNIWLDAYESQQNNLLGGKKNGFVDRKGLEDLFSRFDVEVIKDGSKRFAVVSIEDNYVKVVEEGDAIAVKETPAAEIAKFKRAREILQPKRAEQPDAFKKIEERLTRLETAQIMEDIDRIIEKVKGNVTDDNVKDAIRWFCKIKGISAPEENINEIAKVVKVEVEKRKEISGFPVEEKVEEGQEISGLPPEEGVAPAPIMPAQIEKVKEKAAKPEITKPKLPRIPPSVISIIIGAFFTAYVIVNLAALFTGAGPATGPIQQAGFGTGMVFVTTFIVILTVALPAFIVSDIIRGKRSDILSRRGFGKKALIVAGVCLPVSALTTGWILRRYFNSFDPATFNKVSGAIDKTLEYTDKTRTAEEKTRAKDLLLLTAAMESGFDENNLVQREGGRGRGFFQMEPEVAIDVIKNSTRIGIYDILRKLGWEDSEIAKLEDKTFIEEKLVSDPVFAALLARCMYLRLKDGLPRSYLGSYYYWYLNYYKGGEFRFHQYVRAQERLTKTREKEIEHPTAAAAIGGLLGRILAGRAPAKPEVPQAPEVPVRPSVPVTEVPLVSVYNATYGYVKETGTWRDYTIPVGSGTITKKGVLLDNEAAGKYLKDVGDLLGPIFKA